MARSVAIIGGGIAGLSSAYYAARRGLRVTVLDREEPEAPRCSFGNAGMLVPSHFTPLAAPGMLARGLRQLWSPRSAFSVRPRPSLDLLRWAWLFWRACDARRVERAAPLLRDLALRSRALFDEWARDWGGDFGLTHAGLLMLCRTRRGLDEEARLAEQARALGLPAEVLDAQKTAEREPGAALDVAGAVHYPLDSHLDPGRLLAALRAQAERAGAVLEWRREVSSLRVERGHVRAARTGAGDVEADEFVVCAGAWSSGLLRGLGLRLPLQAGKGYSLTLPEAPVRLRACAILSEAHVALTPLGSALRVGGTLELGGLDRRENRARVRGILDALGGYLPALTPEIFRDVPVWSGLRPCSPDGLPYLGRFARLANLSAVTGHAMLGVSLGPVSGLLLAELLCGDTPSIDISALRPDRHG